MKNFIILIFGLFTVSAFGQTNDDSQVISSTSSAPVKVIFIGNDTLTDIPVVQASPKLEISNLYLTGVKNEGIISSDESGYLCFIIKNTGQGDAYNLRLYVSETNGIAGLNYNNHKFIAKKFGSGEIQFDSIYIEGRNNLNEGEANLELILHEANGNKSPVAKTSVITRESGKPDIDILSYDIYRINERELRIQMTVMNTGPLNLKDVRVNINCPKTFYIKGDSMIILPLLKPYETAEINFTFAQNQYFNELVNDVFKVNLEDSNGHAIGLQKEFIRSLENSYSTGSSTTMSIISDVDVNIPVSINKSGNNNIYALIIGNEIYSRNKPVPFAEKDALIFKEYCLRTFNIPNENITILTNATGNQMKEALQTITSKAMNNTGGESEIIIYYSGYSVIAKDKYSLSNNDFDQYLIPVDVTAIDTILSISRKDIYAVLNDLPLKKVSIFLETCNIPGGKVVSKVAKCVINANIFVFASSSPDQFSLTYDEKGHGLFTYFLLKSIQDIKRRIEYGELVDRVTKNVERYSSNKTDKKQTPTTDSSLQTGDSWKKWRLSE